MHKCTYGPGKFEGETPLTWLAWQAIMNGGGDDDIGRYTFLRAPFDGLLDFATPDAPFCPECCKQDVEAAKDVAGIVICERDDGFVCGEWLNTTGEYWRAVNEAEKEEMEDLDQ